MTITATCILGIETTTNICSVALWHKGQMFELVNEEARAHSKTILPMIEQLLRQANVSMSDIEAIACTRGPGSFTGVRIGIGVAKGLAYGQDIPIIPVSPLATIAYRALISNPTTDSVWAMMDARMGELYVAEYQRKIVDNELVFPQLVGAETLTSLARMTVKPQYCAGTGAQEYKSQLQAENAQISDVIYPYASDVVNLARMNYEVAVSAEVFKPVYLRDKVTD